MPYRRIAVTGACGLLGSYVCAEFERAGHAVTRIDVVGAADRDVVLTDITDLDRTRAALREHDAVIHLAALANVWSGTPEDIMRVNVTGVWNVLRAAEAEGVRRIVLCSSDSAIGFTVDNGHLQAPASVPIDTDHPMNATDPYGISKALGETIARSFARRGAVEVVVLRPVFILYPDMLHEVAARLNAPDTYKWPAANGRTPAGGGQLWHYVDPRDAARAFRLATEMPDVHFATFFVSGPNTLHPQPTLERLAAVTTCVPTVRDANLYARRPHAPLYDLEDARRRLGYEPLHDLRPAVFAAAIAPAGGADLTTGTSVA